MDWEKLERVWFIVSYFKWCTNNIAITTRITLERQFDEWLCKTKKAFHTNKVFTLYFVLLQDIVKIFCSIVSYLIVRKIQSSNSGGAKGGGLQGAEPPQNWFEPPQNFFKRFWKYIWFISDVALSTVKKIWISFNFVLVIHIFRIKTCFFSVLVVSR